MVVGEDAPVTQVGAQVVCAAPQSVLHVSVGNHLDIGYPLAVCAPIEHRDPDWRGDPPHVPLPVNTRGRSTRS